MCLLVLNTQYSFLYSLNLHTLTLASILVYTFKEIICPDKIKRLFVMLTLNWIIRRHSGLTLFKKQFIWVSLMKINKKIYISLSLTHTQIKSDSDGPFINNGKRYFNLFDKTIWYYVFYPRINFHQYFCTQIT